MGTYQGVEGVSEVLLEGGSILYWDQIKVPRAVREYGIDVLFNPKYSIPLRANCKTAWVCHGMDWYAMPEASPFMDRLSHRFLVPRYAAKADALIAVSEITREHLLKYLKVSAAAHSHDLLRPERRVPQRGGHGRNWPRSGNSSRCRHAFCFTAALSIRRKTSLA